MPDIEDLTRGMFSTQVFSAQCPGFEEHREHFLKSVLVRKKDDPGIERSNKNAWHSRTDFHIYKTDSSIRWLTDSIRAMAKACYQAQVSIDECWANVNGKGGWNAPHNHPGHEWSGVFYIRATGGSFIEFENPISWGNVSTITVEPEDGTLLLFSGKLMHFVHPNTYEQERVSISFNLSRAAPA